MFDMKQEVYKNYEEARRRFCKDELDPMIKKMRQRNSGEKRNGCWFGEELGCLGVAALVILAVIEYVRWRMWEDE